MSENDSSWTDDIPLFDGTFRYYDNLKRPVRGKLHVRDEQDWPLKKRQGMRSVVLLYPYVTEPNLILRVARDPQRYAAGEIIGTKVAAYREVLIGYAEAWYYPEDRVLVLRECFLEDFVCDLPLLEDTNIAQLWTGFERWLLEHFPDTESLETPWRDPQWQPIEYQAFLRKRGYHEGKAGIYRKFAPVSNLIVPTVLTHTTCKLRNNLEVRV